jgi:3-oxoacyl-[acyl-carrier protein] reductase
MFDLIIITGASKGIGSSIATDCSNICRKMIITSSSDKIFSNKTLNPNCEIIPIKLDLYNHKNVYNEIKNLVKDRVFNSIGIVLCGAQIGEYGGLFDSNLEDWDKLYRCNTLGNLAVVKACSEIIKSGAKTRIVFFGGGGAASNYPDFSGYALSKVSVVRAVENLAIELSKINKNASSIVIAPGAVNTDMLEKVLSCGGEVKTRTEIYEPTNFVHKFLCDEFPSIKLNGMFLHVRDNINAIDFDINLSDFFKLRRIQ